MDSELTCCPHFSRQINAGICRDLAKGIAEHCPKAFVLVISNPVNSTVPVFAEVFKAAGTFDAKRSVLLLRASTKEGSLTWFYYITTGCSESPPSTLSEARRSSRPSLECPRAPPIVSLVRFPDTSFLLRPSASCLRLQTPSPSSGATLASPSSPSSPSPSLPSPRPCWRTSPSSPSSSRESSSVEMVSLRQLPLLFPSRTR